MLREQYHLVGIAGVGMSALAGALLDAGRVVTGSDRHHDGGSNAAVLDKLIRSGARLYPQDGTGVAAGASALVVSTAIEPDNPDVLAAARLGLPVEHRAEVLGRFLEGRCAVAVTGTSGKSTVTGMLGWILDQAGRDPLVINGAPVVNWTTATRLGNVRSGRGGYAVVEADESDRSLLALEPDWGVVTNASRDHFELAETLSLFARFTAKARRGVVDGGQVAEALGDLRIRGSREGVSFVYRGLDCRLRLPGAHNASNAALAMWVAEVLGVAPEVSGAALARFDGIERRLQRRGGGGGVDVYDDYGHNPAKIAAAYEALAPFYERLVVIWRPHGYGPLRTMFAELAAMFARCSRPADRLLILPVYDAGGSAQRDVSAAMLVEALRVQGVDAVGVAAEEAQGAALAALAGAATAAVVTMGARDPGLPLLAGSLAACLAGAAGQDTTGRAGFGRLAT